MKLQILIILLFLISTSTISSQELVESAAKSRPKIGLVLSGGGAKGLAHIGVLKIIEKAGIKIDFIGGTSMGAIIGGLYASGYNASQIDSLLTKVNFDDLLSDKIYRGNKNFIEKTNNERYSLVLPFEKYQISIPQSFSKGIYNFNMLNAFLRNSLHIRDFNKLPTPFLCIATNIENGEQVILNHGNLAEAILASSALPSLFSPVEIGGKLLVDGGIVNNYPIDEVRNLGADIIIGVDVQENFADRIKLKDASRIIIQISNFHSFRKIDENQKKTDIYIKPNIENFTIMSFDSAEEIIERGEEKANEIYQQLKSLSEENNPYKKPKLKTKTDSLHIKNINCNSLKNYTHEYVLGKLRFKPGEKISFADLKRGIENLDSTENFSAISYSFLQNGSGDDLDLTLTENQIKTYLKFGLHFDGLYKGGVIANFSKKNILAKNDLASLDFILGTNFRFNFNYLIDFKYNLGIGMRVKSTQFSYNIPEKAISGKSSNLYRNINYNDVANIIYLQSTFINKFLLRTGIELKYLKLVSNPDNEIIENSWYGDFFSNLKFDSLDNKYFPKKGWFFDGNFQAHLFSSNFTGNFTPFSTVKVKTGAAVPISQKITLQLNEEAGFFVGHNSLSFFNFMLGGYGFDELDNSSFLYGYDFLSLSGNTYASTLGTLDYQFFKKNHLTFSFNTAALQLEQLDNIPLNFSSFKFYKGYAVGYGLETIIGPLELKYSLSKENPKGFLWFNIGFTF